MRFHHSETNKIGAPPRMFYSYWFSAFSIASNSARAFAARS
jgi:hypothetical protein